MRPLYNALAIETRLERNAGNAGLWYDKFCNEWRATPDNPTLSDWTLTTDSERDSDNPKLTWINSLTKNKVGETTELEQFCERQTKLLATYGQSPLFFKTDWRFVTGLGREHPVENGFAWHHTFGVPYLPGSSIKGMVRAYAQFWSEGDIRNTDRIESIFGPSVRSKSAKSVGSVIFLDAIPLSTVQLEADVMTPHYGPYYQDASGKIEPGDWHSPTPLPFLVVSADTTFQFGLLPRRRDKQSELNLVRRWLSEALDWIGAGAKTAVGYGRMSEDTAAVAAHKELLERKRQDEVIKEIKEQERNMSAEQLQCHNLLKLLRKPGVRSLSDDRNTVMEAAAKTLKAAKKWPSEGDRMLAADTLERVYDTLGWGSAEKEDQRRTAIDQMRAKQD